MCKLFDDWYADIQNFCKENNYSFEKAKSLSQCWGSDFLALQFFNPESGKSGLLDETPMPLVLMIKKTPQGLVFEQNENTSRYLS